MTRPTPDFETRTHELIAATCAVWSARVVSDDEGPICIEVSRLTAAALRLLGVEATTMTCSAYYMNETAFRALDETPDGEDVDWPDDAISVGIGVPGVDPTPGVRRWEGGSWDGHVVVVADGNLMIDFDAGKQNRPGLPVPPVVVGRLEPCPGENFRWFKTILNDQTLACWRETPGRPYPEDCGAATSDVTGMAEWLARHALLVLEANGR